MLPGRGAAAGHGLAAPVDSGVPDEAWVEPARRGGTVRPGLPRLRPGVERYVVPACGSVTAELCAGDRITLVDPQGSGGGGQTGELLAFDAEGRSSAGLLGGKAAGRAEGLLDLLARGDPAALRLRDYLAARRLALGMGEALTVFGPDSRAAASASFTAEVPVTLIAAAPGVAMAPDAQNPPGSLTLFIERAKPQQRPRRAPPPPLADPLLDETLTPGTARAYEVKAGEWIQILDVQGRECSDFQAFSLRALERGLMRDIDPTTTRTLNGSLYPLPGLAPKYFSVDHEPLVEVVPADDALVVEAHIRPSDIAFLYPGQPVKVKLTAYDFARYGGLDGELVTIAADAVEMPESGELMYPVEVRTDGYLYDADNQPLDIMPGMVAEIDILSGKRSVLDYLMEPVVKVRDRALRD